MATDPAHPPHDASSTSRRPFYGLGFWNWLIYRSTWLAILPLLRGPIRLKGFGHDKIPQSGPLLLLPDHHTMLDPFMAGWLPVRPSRFMTSEQPLKQPILGRWLRALGSFPKKKFVKDRASMLELQGYYDEGHLITIFPAGARSWDGRPAKLGTGIGRLVKRLGATVVLSRLVTAYYFWPRWATYPRFVPVHIEYEGPLTWPDSATEEEITAVIQQGLASVQRIPEGYVTFGLRMAHGLPAFLWACPSCFSTDALRVHRRNGNRVVCVDCHAQWAVEVDTTLRAQRDHPSWTVAEAWDRLADHFGRRPVADRERFAAEGVVLSAGAGQLLRARKEGRGFEAVALGRLVLTAEGLSVGDNDPWVIRFEDIVAVSVELGNKVQVRTADALYRMVPGDGSVLKWGHFVHEWRCAVQDLPRSPLG